MHFGSMLLLAAVGILAVTVTTLTAEMTESPGKTNETLSDFAVGTANATVDDNEKQFQVEEHCAIITCNRRQPYCCKGYHCSIQLFMLGGLGFCHFNQPPRPGSSPIQEIAAVGDLAAIIEGLKFSSNQSKSENTYMSM